MYGTKADIEEIGRMIESLDQPLPLARIDTIFVMVDLTEQNQRGIDALFSGLEWSKFARGPRSDNLFGEPVTQSTQVATTGSDGQPTGNTETMQRAVDSNTLQGVLGVPLLLNTSVPFQLQDWELTGIRWDQIFALSSERNDVRIFSTHPLMVSHNVLKFTSKLKMNATLSSQHTMVMLTRPKGQIQGRDQITARTELQIKSQKLDFLSLMKMEV